VSAATHVPPFAISTPADVVPQGGLNEPDGAPPVPGEPLVPADPPAPVVGLPPSPVALPPVLLVALPPVLMVASPPVPAGVPALPNGSLPVAGSLLDEHPAKPKDATTST
jgi:hypothetical protein